MSQFLNRVIDLHCDSVSSLVAGKDLRGSVPDVHIDLPRLKKGGVGLQVFAAYIPPSTEVGKAFALANELLDAIDAFARSDMALSPVVTAAGAKAIMAAGKTGVMAAVENGLAIEKSIDKLKSLRQRNVRIMTLVHSEHLDWVASCTGKGEFVPDTGSGRGLSRFGLEVVDAMNDLGIIPDVSHSSESAFWDVIRHSKKPIIASHSCAWAICAAARNLKDDQLKALGDSGGVAGVNFYSSFLHDRFRIEHENLRLAAKENSAAPVLPDIHVPMSIIADHIDHMVKMAGEDCVALGSDFDGIPAAPIGVTGCDYYPVLEAELKSRNYSETRIEKIFCGNFLRLLAEWD